MSLNFEYKSGRENDDDEEQVLAFGFVGATSSGNSDDGDCASPKKRARTERVSEKRMLDDWRRRESLRFGLADPRTLRKYCLEYLAASQTPSPAIVDNEENFALPTLASNEMDSLIERCRAWREAKWHERFLINRKQRVDEQRARRRCQRRHLTMQQPHTPPPLTHETCPTTPSNVDQEEEFLAALLLCDLRK